MPLIAGMTAAEPSQIRLQALLKRVGDAAAFWPLEEKISVSEAGFAHKSVAAFRNGVQVQTWTRSVTSRKPDHDPGRVTGFPALWQRGPQGEDNPGDRDKRALAKRSDAERHS